MRKILSVLTAASLLALSGCATQEAVGTAVPAISDNAKSALAAAQATVREARARNALWTTADEALKAAEAAERKGDSAAVISNAQKAQDHARMGIQQLDYPLQQIKDM